MSKEFTSTRLMTEDDLFLMPDDGYRYELVEGELRQMTPAGFEHGRSTGNLHEFLSSHVRSRRLGYVLAAETGFIIGRTPDGRVTVRAADISFVSKDRIPTGADLRKYLELAPDLVVETLSPSDTAVEVEEKIASWLAAGVRCAVVLNPTARSVNVHGPDNTVIKLTDEDELDLDPVVSGFRCRVSEIFD
ncbi:MAG TPA: Uma2 family endonuclease [Blastocatellia bacterium]|nr:Uma2 family endonuclease [Blastocatellia bacterium]